MLKVYHGDMMLMLLLVLSILDKIPSLEEASFQVEIEALKAFKSSIIQDSSVQVLADWSDGTHHCNWTGISCDPLSNHVVSLSLPHKRLKGQISPFLGNISTLQFLNLGSNSFTGSIPESICSCTSLSAFDISFNNLTGMIPPCIGKLVHLKYINLTLCGTSFFRPCNTEEKSNAPRGILLFGCAFVTCGICFRKRNRSRPLAVMNEPPLFGILKKFSQRDLEIATNWFDENNLIAWSRSSTIYKGIIELGTYHKNKITESCEIVAVKKWELLEVSAESDDCFRRELNTADNLKHRNLVKMIGYGWKGEFKALVLEYMVNGTLESIMHDPSINKSRWSFSQRLNVCVSVAKALVYLHLGFAKPVVHCDVNPSRIFFDGDWEAHLSNFGTSRMLGIDVRGWTGCSSSSSFSETGGYLAPEHAHTSQATTKADVFSFGIVMMEFLTTRRPTETIEENGFPLPITLRQFVEVSLKNGFKRLLEVVDPYFAQSISIQEEEERMIDVLGLALSCTHPDPCDRPDMNQVLHLLEKIKEI